MFTINNTQQLSVAELRVLNSAVRKACRNTHVNDQSVKTAKALEILGVNSEAAHNHGLAYFDTKSIIKAVINYFSK